MVTQFNPENTLEYSEEEIIVLGHIFAQQYGLAKGLRKFGDRGEAAVIKELTQLHDRTGFEPIDVNELTPEERETAMDTIMLLTEKRDGTIKGRGVADGRKQRSYIKKEEAASPTVATESILISATIDAKERRATAVIDIPNAYIQTPNHKVKEHHREAIMKVKGKLAEYLVKVAPEVYGPYIVYENGVPVIYLRILKAIYGQIISALLFYRKLRADLEEAGFVVNPYNACVANKMVNGKQLTILWHVDDLKASHVEEKVLDEFIEWVRKKYEDPGITKLKPSRGKVHDYLGIILDYSEDGKVKIDMRNYVKGMLEDFPYMDQVDKLKRVSTPAAEHLFNVNEKAEKLPEKLKQEFHTAVAKGLFVCKRARPDLQPTIPFLCTRVKAPDVDDWKKLLRFFKYLENTKDLVLILEADQGPILWNRLLPDAAFAVHPDYKSHTGICYTLGKGAVTTTSAKQKLNTRSSTEAELVAANEAAVQAMWIRNFLEAQGYDSKTTIYQDNTSAILLEKNGRESSGKRTRHLNVRYYYIKDCIDKKFLNVEYCPTDDMTGDYPSKPLQGRKFRKHRRAIMNEPAQDINVANRSVLEHEFTNRNTREISNESSESRGTSE